MCALYFAAVGVAFLNDRRKGRGQEIYAGIADDEISPLELTTEPVGAADPDRGARRRSSAPAPVHAPNRSSAATTT